MNRPRTVADMYGAGQETTPTVSQSTDGEDFTVTVNLTPVADILIEALAAALTNDDGAFWEWQTLVHNKAEDGARRDLAVRELLTNPQVQRALTIEFTPDAADELSGLLEQAAIEPDRCEGTLYAGTRTQPPEGCRNFAAPGEHHCPAHLPADPEEDYEL